jgi:elongin-A
MTTDLETSNRRIPTLVTLCQRGEDDRLHRKTDRLHPLTVASTHVDCMCRRSRIIPGSNSCIAITGLGDDLTYPLVKPILERCSAEQLLRLEHASPVCQLNAYVDHPQI